MCLTTTQATGLKNHSSGSPAAPSPPPRLPTGSLFSDEAFDSRVPDPVETRPRVDTPDMSPVSPMIDCPSVALPVTLPPPSRSWHSFKGFPSFCSALPQLERSGLCSTLDHMKATGSSRQLSLPEDETPGKKELVVLGLTKADLAQDCLKTAASEACCCLTGTLCCLCCAKQLVNEGVYCSQLNCTARCHCCSSLQNKCDSVPPPFKVKMGELQALSDNVTDRRVELSILSNRAKKFVSEIDNYFCKQSLKKNTEAILSGSAMEMNNLLQMLSAQADVPVPPLPEEEFCGEKVNDE
ncbi:hypothetical protein AJ79_10307 [Helicocarpus griseus UAMH5409]|uniref:Uncharacterized protein n=1 Tax=Helicocarpus griseus UAMH5409 TaxID=1447875 RepID=A0A2B7W6A0_9EURO|nr:hypothetical protein AJ79_10307 [Helicocarpus griseus UAMH5409]